MSTTAQLEWRKIWDFLVGVHHLEAIEFADIDDHSDARWLRHTAEASASSPKLSRA